jgi:hypothetical protein
MTVDQVDAIMERWVIDPSPARLSAGIVSEDEDLIVYRLGDAPMRFLGDYGLVRFREGRVRDTLFGRE